MAQVLNSTKNVEYNVVFYCFDFGLYIAYSYELFG